MNKLYILGALALANVEAYINFGTSTYAGKFLEAAPTIGIFGTYTYSISADCFSSGTATTLGLNNIYH
jgi:hypothetical protein